MILVAMLLSGVALAAPFIGGPVTHPSLTPAREVALSVGVSILTAYIFYFVVSAGLERRRRRTIKAGAISAYQEAKRNIAWAVLQASIKGGRDDLSPTNETVDRLLTIPGFRAAFEGGKQANEGFYAFQNEMSERTFEFDEIVFNLKVASRALDRVVDNYSLEDAESYQALVRLNTLLARIEANGAGYDDSKLLCGFIWQIFAGWNPMEGQRDYDPVQRVLDRL